MKKLAIAGAIIALSSSAFAADNSFYLKAGGLGNMGHGYTKDTLDIKKGKLSEHGYGLTVGVGYNLMDNLRVEANGSYLFGIKYAGTKFTDTELANSGNNALNKDDKKDHELDISGFKAMLNANIDVVNLGPAKLYVGGGIGASYINGQVTTQTVTEKAVAENGGAVTPAKTESKTQKYGDALNFAYEVGAGIAYEISEGVNLDLGYKLENLGLPGNEKDSSDEKSSWKEAVSKESPWVHSVNLGVRFSL